MLITLQEERLQEERKKVKIEVAEKLLKKRYPIEDIADEFRWATA